MENGNRLVDLKTPHVFLFSHQSEMGLKLNAEGEVQKHGIFFGALCSETFRQTQISMRSQQKRIMQQYGGSQKWKFP